jgi:hypothetical protein
MAHFAELDADNIVVRVLVVPNEQENRGHDYLATDLGLGGTWVQTSYNATIRKNYAGIGYTFDSGRDAFIPPKPYASWTLNEDTCNWEAPVAYPDDEKMYTWDEATTSWVEVEVPA